MKIAAHLRSKNIDPEVISTALSLLDDDQYRQMITDTLNSHRKFVKAKNQYDLKGKLLRFGLSKGFESQILYDILNEIDWRKLFSGYSLSFNPKPCQPTVIEIPYC